MTALTRPLQLYGEYWAFPEGYIDKHFDACVQGCFIGARSIKNIDPTSVRIMIWRNPHARFGMVATTIGWKAAMY